MAGDFEPKIPVTLDPPKDDPITVEHLKKCNGTDGYPCYGVVFDVNYKAVYMPGGSYQNFAGHDASRALGMSTTDKDHVKADYSGLSEEHLDVLNKWVTYFSKRYNIVGKVVEEKDNVVEEKDNVTEEKDNVAEEKGNIAEEKDVVNEKDKVEPSL
ncbi:hypothetical protein V491_00959 [Pseudogymnoascus sp. VKM F-3775]|nr:hypothetical protein V491_00959 [Pseudogymnoascus sp. VKM F-3775]